MGHPIADRLMAVESAPAFVYRIAFGHRGPYAGTTGLGGVREELAIGAPAPPSRPGRGPPDSSRYSENLSGSLVGHFKSPRIHDSPTTNARRE
jgi:hypothetical protein